MIHSAKIKALAIKETRQILRDPSVFMIAFLLPVILLFLFAYAVSLDLKKVPIGLILESQSAKAESLAGAFSGSISFVVHPARKPKDVMDALVAGQIRGYVVIPQDFDQRLSSNEIQPAIQVITDGTQPNTASFVANYAQGVFATWAEELSHQPARGAQLIPRYRFNPEIESHRFLIPGAIAVVMTIIGTLLTALVIAREWERGTMEAIFSTPASVTDIIIGKLIPYFFLGLGATIVATLLAVNVFDVPMRGSWPALLLTTSAFLFPALGQGLLISTASKNQFIASQVALFSGFLPAFLLSGFLYQISSMPLPLRALTHVIPARYFVDSLQTLFLAGDVWNVFFPNIGAMILIGFVFFLLVHRKTRKSLDA
jgi:ABC-2 type transport system permease protein